MWDGFNKRKFPRLALRCEVVIHTSDRPSPIVTLTENLGAGGVCILLDQPLERFSKCSLRLDLDEKHPRIECKGKVVWTVKTGEVKDDRPLYDTGIEFEGLDDVVIGRLRQFIEAQAGTAPQVGPQPPR